MPVVGIDIILIPHISCFKCDRKRYYSDKCPEVEGDMEAGVGNKVPVNSQHVQEDQITTEEGDIQERVIQHMSGGEIEVDVIDDDNSEYDINE